MSIKSYLVVEFDMNYCSRSLLSDFRFQKAFHVIELGTYISLKIMTSYCSLRSLFCDESTWLIVVRNNLILHNKYTWYRRYDYRSVTFISGQIHSGLLNIHQPMEWNARFSLLQFTVMYVCTNYSNNDASYHGYIGISTPFL